MTVTKTFDLHGLKHDEAEEMVENFLIINSLAGNLHVKVITGQSEAMQDRMRKICGRLEMDYYIPVDNNGVMIIQYTKL